MSEKNTDEKRAARDRLAAERQREQTVAKRLRLLKVLGASVAVLGVVGLVAYTAGTGGEDGEEGVAAAEGPPAEPLVLGEDTAPVTLTVYQDFRCAACGQLERELRDTVHELEAEGTLRSEYHPVSILGGVGSRMAGNAAACAADAGHLAEYQALLFDNQPTDGTDAFADDAYLIELAGEVSGLDTEEFRSCVADETHVDWVDRTTSDFLDAGHTATPTVLINGERVFGDAADEPLTAEVLAERVAELAAQAADDGETEEAPDAEEPDGEHGATGGDHDADPPADAEHGDGAGYGEDTEATGGIAPDPAPEAGDGAGGDPGTGDAAGTGYQGDGGTP